MSNLVGKTIGFYEVKEKLGKGAMAEVYKAYHPKLERYAALKIIFPGLADEADFLSRFEMEGKALARLDHPNIVRIYDFGEDEETQCCYLVMEYIAGDTLKEWLHKRGELSLEQVLPILRDVSEALDYAHGQDVLHRDVKPANIMFAGDGRAKLGDFGVAKLIIGDEARLTQTGTIIGTPAYMSPEQAKGEKEIRTCSDIYSLGVVLYEVLTGQIPFTGETAVDVMLKRLQEKPIPPRTYNPDISERVQDVILKVLAIEPEKRYQRAGELVAAFDSAVAAASPGQVGVGAVAPVSGTTPVEAGDTDASLAQWASLSIQKKPHGEENEYAFSLILPGERWPISDYSTISIANEQEIKNEIDRAVQHIHSRHGLNSLIELGRMLYDILLPAKISKELAKAQCPLWLDAQAPGIPWELCHDGQDFLFVRLTMGRRPNTRPVDIPSALLSPGETPVCLIIAPANTEDLPGANEEAYALNEFFGEQGAEVDCLVESHATFFSVSQALRNHRYHIIHICGHAKFSHDNEPAIVLAEGTSLTTSQIKSSLQGTPLVFVNACESGLEVQKSQEAHGMPAYYSRLVGLPVAFMEAKSGHASAYIGTPWRIEDVKAKELSLAFYEGLFDGKPVEQALQQAREKARKITDNAIWASFALWGLPGLQLYGPRATAEVTQPQVEVVQEPVVAEEVEVLPRVREEEEALPTPAPEIRPVLDDGQLNLDRLGTTARQVLHDAELEMVLTGADFITTTHFFIGLTKVDDGTTQVALQRQGFNPEDTRDLLRGRAFGQTILTALIANGETELDKKEDGIGYSKSVTEILRRADQLAREQDNDAAQIEEQHLFLGFLGQGGGTTRRAMEEWDVDWDAMRAFAEGQPTLPYEHPLFEPGGELLTGHLAPEMQRALQWAWEQAHQRTANYLATPYFMEALFETGSCLRDGIQAQHVNPQDAQGAIHDILEDEQPHRSQGRTSLYLYDLSHRVQNILRLADEEAQKRNAALIAQPHVLMGFLRDGGGHTRRVLKKVGVDVKVLDAFVRQKCLNEPPPPPPTRSPLFLPDGSLYLQAFDESGSQVLDLATQEALNIDLKGVDTRRLVLGLAGLPDGDFAVALARQGWDVDRLRVALQPGFGRRPQKDVPDKLVLTRRNLSQSVVVILDRAWTKADQEKSKAVSERHIVLAFLDSGGRWTQGGASDLGLDIWRLHEDVSNESASSEPEAAAEAVAIDNLLFAAHGELNLEMLTLEAHQALTRSLGAALEAGAAAIDLPQLIWAWLDARGLWPAVLTQHGIDQERVRDRLHKPIHTSGTRTDVLLLERGSFSAELMQLLTGAYQAVEQEGAESLGVRHLLLGLVGLSDVSIVQALTGPGLDLARIRQTLTAHPCFDLDGRLLQERLCLPVLQVLETAARQSALMSHGFVGTPELFLGLLDAPGDQVQWAVRRQGLDPLILRDTVRNLVQGGRSQQGSILLVQTAFSPRVLHILRLANSLAHREGVACMDEQRLALGFVRCIGGVTRDALEHRGLDLARLEKALQKDEETDLGTTRDDEEAVTPSPQPITTTLDVDRDAVADDDVFLPNGQLNRSLFDEQALAVLDQALQAAHTLNHGIVGTPHLTIGMTSLRAGYTNTVLQRQNLRPESVQRAISQMFPPGSPVPGGQQAQLVRSYCSANLRAIFRLARILAQAQDVGRIGERELLLAFLRNGGGHAGAALEAIGLKRRKLLLSLGERLDTPTLDQLGMDLTRQARAGELGPVFGREKEMQKVIEALAMKTKNNPLLVGEAGVGKTAIIEGLAQRIARGDVPDHLQDKRVVQVHTGDLVAGMIYRGQFEERVQQLLDEARQPHVILVIDEIHTLVRAGAAHGATLDASNLFKPALARGEVRVIGATTPLEASRTIERDSALERRFYRIDVTEPDQQEALDILRQLQPERRLPDKAIEALDRACVKVAASQPDSKVVDGEAIVAAVADWQNIPLEQLTKAQQEQLLHLKEALRERIVGQDEAIEAVVHTVWRSRTGLKDPLRPMGVLLFLGPTGVGKTELALVLAEQLHGSREAAIRLDMTEFQEPHTISKLIGVPAGYEGYHDEGQLSGPLRQRPASIVLLDEVDKVLANTGILDVFMQLFDNGRMKDGQGRLVDGRNALFIMTANVTSDLFKGHRRMGFHQAQPIETQAFQDEVRSELLRHFRDDFLSRVDEVIVFKALERDDGRAILDLKLLALKTQLLENEGVEVSWDEAVTEFLLDKGFSPDYGARALKKAIRDWVEKPLSEERMHKQASQIHLGVTEGQICFELLE